MRRKVILISGIVVPVILILVFTGYNIYRDSAMFRNLPGHASGLAQEEGLRNETLSQAEQEIKFSGLCGLAYAVVSASYGRFLYLCNDRKFYTILPYFLRNRKEKTS